MTMTARSYGYKYDEQKGKSTAEVAALMRRDIKAAVRDGLLPGAPVKYSVRTHTYSGGASIDITVMGWSAAWMDCDGYVPGEPRVAGRGRDLCPNYFCAARVELLREQRPGAQAHQVLTPDARAAEMTLKRIHSAYNHDGSDSMVDHFDVNYYGSVTFEDARHAEFRAQEEAKKATRRAQVDELEGKETRRVVVYGSKGKRTVHDAVDVDGRIRLVCGATLWRHSLTGDGEGHELTCTRCVKRAERRESAELAPAPADPPARVMRTYDVLSRNKVVQLRPGAKLVRIAQFRTSADTDAAAALITAMFPDAVSYRAAGELAWRNLR